MDGNVSKKEEIWKIVHHVFGGQFGLKGTKGTLESTHNNIQNLKMNFWPLLVLV